MCSQLKEHSWHYLYPLLANISGFDENGGETHILAYVDHFGKCPPMWLDVIVQKAIFDLAEVEMSYSVIYLHILETADEQITPLTLAQLRQSLVNLGGPHSRSIVEKTDPAYLNSLYFLSNHPQARDRPYNDQILVQISP